MGIVAFIVTAPFAKPLRIQMSALGQKRTLQGIKLMYPQKRTSRAAYFGTVGFTDRSR